VDVDRARDTIAVVMNPRTLRGPSARLWQEAVARLRRNRPVECVYTAGDGSDRARIAALIAERPATVVAAGGDGTLHEVVNALHRADPATAPALAILPLGTANNVARSVGLLSVRGHGAHAVDRACAAILGGTERRIDLGRVGSDVFIGSFALGMDAAILARRNAWCRRWRLGPRSTGYPLYLLSCAVNLTRHRTVAGRVQTDDETRELPVYDALVANTALYAAEFRFDDGDYSADGLLDLQIFSSAADYVRAFVAAWRRHLSYQRGARVAAPARLRRVMRVEIALAQPLASQLDGEEYRGSDRFDVQVIPRALRLHV
jgi:diacylglycerol kinase family enzyme